MIDVELKKLLDESHTDLARLALRLHWLEKRLKELDAAEPKRAVHLAIVKNGDHE